MGQARLVGCSTSVTYKKTSSINNNKYYTYYINLSTLDWDYAILKSMMAYVNSNDSSYNRVFGQSEILIPKGVTPLNLAILNRDGGCYTLDWNIGDNQFSTVNDFNNNNEYYSDNWIIHVELYKYVQGIRLFNLIPYYSYMQ